MSQYNMFCDEFVKTDEYNFAKIQDLVKVNTKLDSDCVFDFYMKDVNFYAWYCNFSCY